MTVSSTDELLAADFEKIHLAEVRLKKGDPPKYVKGRIAERFDHDLTLRWRGRNYSVPLANEWELVRFTPITSETERLLIRGEMK